MSKYFNPVKTFFGIDKIKELKSIINYELEVNRVMLFIGGQSLRKSGNLELILKQLQEKKIIIYDNIPSNPDIGDLYKIKNYCDNQEYDAIISIGGGSVIDIGKSISALQGLKINDIDALRETINSKSYLNNDKKVPIIAIPTTAGTGSEVTCWATIWDKQKKVKYSISNEDIYPTLAIVDPKLTLTMPTNITVTTALDALTHATEAFWSKDSNEIVRMYALRAIENIIENIEPLIDKLDDLELRTKISNGSLFAGLAFSNTRTTSCHSISYPLTSLYGISHGVAVSMTLGKMIKINEIALKEKEKLLSAFKVNDLGEIDNLIKRIYQKAYISYKLRDYGIRKEDIELILNKAVTPSRMNNNPIVVTKQMIRDILNDIY